MQNEKPGAIHERREGRILIVDDDEDFVHMLVYALESRGYQVEVAHSAQGALEKITAFDAQVALLDIRLGRDSGIDLMTQLKEARPGILCVMMTAYAALDTAIEAIHGGAYDYLQKPLNMRYLLAILDRCFEKLRLESEKAAADEILYRYNERLKILNEIHQSILAARSLETIALAAMSRIRLLVPCQRAVVMTVEESGHIETLAAESSGKIESKADLNVYQEMFRGQSLSSGRIQGAVDLATLPRRSPMQQALYAAGVRSYLVVPLFVQDELVGTLNLDADSPGAFTPDHITIAAEVAVLLAVAIRQVRLYEQAQQEIAERMRVEESLRQQTLELEARNAELDAFAHTVAHDLKNPLTALMGYGSLLESNFTKMPEKKVRRDLQVIGQSGRKMSNIIDELLLLASVRKMDEVRIEPLDMAAIVTEAQGRLDYLIEEHQADIILPQHWPATQGYAPWVEEVWVNYLSNAIKYGGRPPRVELGATEQADGTVCFWVRDNGPGLTPEQQENLFTLFTRFHQVRAEGHGLGLSIVQRIVDKCGGQVGVESQTGQGSVFSFTLPGMASQARG